MARQTETQKLQEYADEIWGKSKMRIRFMRFVGFEMSDPGDDRDGRIIGRNAAEAQAELDEMADLKQEQA